MTISNPARARSWRKWLRSLTTPNGMLAGLFVAAGLLYLLPTRLTDPLRDAWMSILQPVETIADDAVQFSRDRLALVTAAFDDGERVAVAERQVTELTTRNQQLALALDAARLGQSESASSAAQGSPTEPLLRSEAVAARVLGHTAQTFLRGRELLDLGSGGGVSPGALVIDAGFDLSLQPGRIVLTGRRIWGKLANVGPHTSTVRRITDPGYRDTVRLAHAGSGGSERLGPRGVLVGAGERLCRIEMVEASEPVSVGDGVFTESDGMLPEPLVYGQVVRVELAADKLHWRIWMQPAAGTDEPREVAVVKVELNRARVVSGEW